MCAHTVNYDEAIRKNSIDSFNSFQYIHPTSQLHFTQFRQHFIKAKRIICFGHKIVTFYFIFLVGSSYFTEFFIIAYICTLVKKIYWNFVCFHTFNCISLSASTFISLNVDCFHIRFVLWTDRVMLRCSCTPYF